jgi:iron complex outermembrane recepter protein
LLSLCLSDGSSLTVKEDLKMSLKRCWRGLPALLLPLAASAASEADLEEVIVVGTVLREQAHLDVPASITVLTDQTLNAAGQQHFESVLALVPNLNWSAGSSRPRYFQLRGIGELEQYEGAPNPSVGFVIDDIDFSGIANAATLFDVAQIEVLRGPQGTRYGANALAGLIAIRSAEPEREFGARVAADAGNYSTGSLGAVVTGPAGADSAWRLAVQGYRSDGFRNNTFLNRDDVMQRDELTVRGKWRWNVAPGRLDITLLHADLDNGYDAFAVDNSRTTLSDRPGEDSQRADGLALRWTQPALAGGSFSAIATALYADSVNAFDGDWSNAQNSAPFTYDFFARSDRRRHNYSLELRLASAEARNGEVAWLVGAYAQQLRESIHEISVGTLIDPDPSNGFEFFLDEFLGSRYRADNIAAFGQVDVRFAGDWIWSTGARAEQRDADYRDAGVWQGDPNRHTTDSEQDGLWGAQSSLTYHVADSARLYAALARGYKAGGFNFGIARQRQTSFDPEFLTSIELGGKGTWLDGNLAADLSLFYMRRKDIQVRSSVQLVAGDPNSFGFFTSNAASGYNYGAEATLLYSPARWLQVGGSVGLLRTQVEGVVLDPTAVPVQVAPSRAQAHAPEYQLQFNASVRHPQGWFARVDFQAVDAFFFDSPSAHNQRSQPYELTNIRVGYERGSWSVSAWSRNVFNHRYATRGFFFGNEPPAFEDTLYVQNGDPRQFGVSVAWSMR